MTQSIRDAAQALLPCPFCGHSKNIAMANTHHDHSGGYYIGCPECGASTELVFALMDDPRQILVEKWNRRAAISAPQPTADERVAELVQTARDIADGLDSHRDAGTESFVSQMLTRIEAAARALLSASQDDAEHAAMYRWLRSKSWASEAYDYGCTDYRFPVLTRTNYDGSINHATVDAAIRAAMKETE